MKANFYVQVKDNKLVGIPNFLPVLFLPENETAWVNKFNELKDDELRSYGWYKCIYIDPKPMIEQIYISWFLEDAVIDNQRGTVTFPPSLMNVPPYLIEDPHINALMTAPYQEATKL